VFIELLSVVNEVVRPQISSYALDEMSLLWRWSRATRDKDQERGILKHKRFIDRELRAI